jgi:hypothetical protein
MAASMGGHHNAGRLGHLLQERTPYDGPAAGLHIVTLGGFAISIDGEHIGHARWGRPKVQQLFRYLLTARNHAAHRDMLMDALWPGLPVGAAWSNLKNAIYRLRRVLEPQLLPRQVSRFLVAEGSSYRLLLGPQDRWDAAEFLRRAEAAQRSYRDEDFAAAAALYGGTIYLMTSTRIGRSRCASGCAARTSGCCWSGARRWRVGVRASRRSR